LPDLLDPCDRPIYHVARPDDKGYLAFSASLLTVGVSTRRCSTTSVCFGT
jgi:hypothetical protein